jgi:hypothetical protein
LLRRCSSVSSVVQEMLLPQQVRSRLDLDDQPARDFAVNASLEQRLRYHRDGALDRPEASQTRARTRQQLAPLLLPPPLGIRLLSVTITNGLALHGRGLALLAMAPPALAAPVVGVPRLQRASCNRPTGLIRALHKL